MKIKNDINYIEESGKYCLMKKKSLRLGCSSLDLKQ